jgi:hypothetical protein
MVAAAAVSVAQPWFDVKSIPGTNNIAVAYRATGGGVTCLIFNPATGATSSVVNTAGADATMCLGWLDDQLATGSMLLGTAGSTSGVVVRTMSATTMVVSATLTISASATANVNNVTGHTVSSASTYTVLWDIYNATAINTRTRVNVVTAGVAGAAQDFMRSCGLESRSFKIGIEYYVMLSYESTTQSTYFMCCIRGVDGNGSMVSQILSGNAGKSRIRASGLTSVPVSGSTATMSVPKQTNVIASNGTFQPVRSVFNVSLSMTTPQAPQEAAGTFFLPGGAMMQVINGIQDLSFHALFPEPPTLTTTVGGAMTPSATYSYVSVYGFITADGRIVRSSPSTPTSVTLGAGDSAVQVTTSCLRIKTGLADQAGYRSVFIEVYRAGPAAAGATGYNRTATMFSSFVQDAEPVTDVMSDANAATGEILYTTGNVLSNLPPPPGNLLSLNANRCGVVNSQDTEEFWFSGEYKDGLGIKFNPLLKMRVSGDGYGGITAVTAMDGRWILFKSQAIYVISGDGPNDLGQGSFNPPQAASLSIGTVIPASVVSTPDGIMFQSAAGIYLLTRGLAVQYLGAPIEKYTMAENVVGASLIYGSTQVRFVTASGRCLVWDYYHQRWYTFQLRVTRSGVASTVVGCANLTSGWCYAMANGDIWQETPGVYSDVNVTTTAIVPSVGFPQVNVGGLAGFQRCYGVLLEGEYVGDHTLQVSASLDLGTVTEPTRSLAVTTGPYLYEVLFANQKCSAIQVNLTCALAAGSGAFRLSGASLVVGLKRGTGIPWTKRLT